MEKTPEQVDVYSAIYIDLTPALQHFQENKHKGKESNFLVVNHSGIVKKYSVEEALALFGF